MHIRQIPDQKLFDLCKKYGCQVLLWRQRFAGLLPEVNRRRLYEKKGFESIFHFAKILAGMSEKHVRMVLSLEKKFEDKPLLQQLLINGEVSANKLVRVAAISTNQNQEFLSDKVKLLSKSALETLVRDEKYFQKITENENKNLGKSNANSKNLSLDFGDRDALNKAKNRDESLPGQTLKNVANPLFISPPEFSMHQTGPTIPNPNQTIFEDLKLLQKLSPELKTKLKQLDQKGLDINKILLEMLAKRDQEIQEEKEQIGEGMPHNLKQKPTRYVKVAIKKILQKEHGNKCSIPTCNNLSEAIHHTQRWSISHNHDPRFIAPLCKQHHEIAHSIDLKCQKNRYLK